MSNFMWFDEIDPVEKAQKTAKAVEAVRSELTERGIFAYVMNADSLPEAEQRLANREVNATINEIVARYMPEDEGAKARLVSSIFKQFEAAKKVEEDPMLKPCSHCDGAGCDFCNNGTFWEVNASKQVEAEDKMPMKDGKPAFLSDEDSDEDEDDSKSEDDKDDKDEEKDEDEEDDKDSDDDDDEDDDSDKKKRKSDDDNDNDDDDESDEDDEDKDSGSSSKSAAKGDPYWLDARYPGVDQNGNSFKAGDKVFYYPTTKTFLTGEAAEKAAREFASAAQDEEFLGFTPTASLHLAEGTIDPRLPQPGSSKVCNCDTEWEVTSTDMDDDNRGPKAATSIIAKCPGCGNTYSVRRADTVSPWGHPELLED